LFPTYLVLTPHYTPPACLTSHSLTPFYASSPSLLPHITHSTVRAHPGLTYLPLPAHLRYPPLVELGCQVLRSRGYTCHTTPSTLAVHGLLRFTAKHFWLRGLFTARCLLVVLPRHAVTATLALACVHTTTRHFTTLPGAVKTPHLRLPQFAFPDRTFIPCCDLLRRRRLLRRAHQFLTGFTLLYVHPRLPTAHTYRRSLRRLVL